MSACSLNVPPQAAPRSWVIVPSVLTRTPSLKARSMLLCVHVTYASPSGMLVRPLLIIGWPKIRKRPDGSL